MGHFEVRVAAGLLLVLAVGWALVRRRVVARTLQNYFLEPQTPTRIACVRIALFASLAHVASQTRAVWLASQPGSLRAMPWGWGVLDDFLPIDGATAQLAQYLVVGGGIAGALGVATRVVTPVAAVAAVYLLGIPSFFGKVLHMDHALVLMCLVLSAAPCGDALSIDRAVARMRGRPVPPPSSAYTLPMRLCWLLLGTVYLFPGLWKVWDNGDLWLNGQRLLWELKDEWGHRTYLDPPARIDRYPALLAILGTATLVFEVGFIFAVLRPAGRVGAAVGAFCFHYGVRLFLGIKFYAFLPLVMCIDLPWWTRLARREKTNVGGTEATASVPSFTRLLGPALVGGALLLGQVSVAVARIETWPVALHPVFGERGGPGTFTYDLEVRLEPRKGRKRNLIWVMSQHGGGHAFRRSVRRFDRDVARGIPRGKTGRELVALLRENRVRIHPGDDVVLYKARWQTYPIGQRAGYQRSLVSRYRVTQDLGLQRVDD